MLPDGFTDCAYCGEPTRSWGGSGSCHGCEAYAYSVYKLDKHGKTADGRDLSTLAMAWLASIHSPKRRWAARQEATS